MRLWSVHPKYLDTKGLVAVWREGLLAKKVLENKTKGYKYHPQLIRFKKFKNPVLAINSYLFYIYKEAEKRGYRFDFGKIKGNKIIRHVLPVTKGQIDYEFLLLSKKLKYRDKNTYRKLINQKKIASHSLFYIIKGDRESWEKIK